MKTAADLKTTVDEAQRTMDCPKCKGIANLMAPIKVVDKRMAVYGCKACGYAFRADGGTYVENTDRLRDFFRGATAGNQTLLQALAGEKLNPATRALLTALMIEYGLQMWYDGLKQGLLLGAVQATPQGGRG